MRRLVPLFGLSLLAIAAAKPQVRAAEADQDGKIDIVQMLADLTAIDQDCRSLSVDFGVGIRFASDHGVPVTDVLPTGARRALFEKDLNETEGSAGASAICGPLAQRYSELLPGSVTFAAPRADP